MALRKSPDLKRCLAGCVAIGWLFFGLPARAIDVVVQLKNGDRITGQLVAQETNHVVITTPWASSIAFPISTIGGLRTAEGEILYTPPAPPKPATPTAPTVASAKVPLPQPKPTPPAKKRTLTTNVNIGVDVLFGAAERQVYYGRIKSTYEHPYDSNPKQYFRTTADYLANYGQTDGSVSANNMAGSVQTDFDFATHNYFYNAANVGYDEIRKIDIQYGVGPGIGRHLYTKPAFVLNVETGANYQVQKRSAGANPESGYFRLGDNLTWKIADRVTLAKKLEFLLNVQDGNEFRVHLDSNLSYRLWNSLSLNFTLLDLYDTNPAPGVNPNELQVRSSLGFTF